MSAPVIVGNVRKPVPDGYTRIYVGRATSYRPEYGEDFSVLGNPYTMPRYTRAQAIRLYTDWLNEVGLLSYHWDVEVTLNGMNTPQGRALETLHKRLKQDERLALLCFCNPKECHADSIRAMLIYGMVQPDPTRHLSFGADCGARGGRMSSFAYIRSYYHVPAKRGLKVTCDGKEGTITGARGPHLIVKPDGPAWPKSYRWYCHPTWRMTYHLPTGDIVYGD